MNRTYIVFSISLFKISLALVVLFSIAGALFDLPLWDYISFIAAFLAAYFTGIDYAKREGRSLRGSSAWRASFFMSLITIGVYVVVVTIIFVFLSLIRQSPVLEMSDGTNFYSLALVILAVSVAHALIIRVSMAAGAMRALRVSGNS